MYFISAGISQFRVEHIKFIKAKTAVTLTAITDTTIIHAPPECTRQLKIQTNRSIQHKLNNFISFSYFRNNREKNI